MKALHAADIADRAAIATATGFIATIFIGTGQHAKAPASSIDDARIKARELEAKFADTHRKALVYAILPAGNQVVVPADYNPAQPAPAIATPKATEQETNMAARVKTFPKRFNAQRAARAMLKNPNAVDGTDFKTDKAPNGEWMFSIAPKNAEPKPAKAAKAAKKAAADKPATGKRAAIEEAARAGKLPDAPDFSAPTHARYRGKLNEIVKLAKAGDVKALKAFPINPISTSPKALDRYRNLAVAAIEARR